MPWRELQETPSLVGRQRKRVGREQGALLWFL